MSISDRDLAGAPPPADDARDLSDLPADVLERLLEGRARMLRQRDPVGLLRVSRDLVEALNGPAIVDLFVVDRQGRLSRVGGDAGDESPLEVAPAGLEWLAFSRARVLISRDGGRRTPDAPHQASIRITVPCIADGARPVGVLTIEREDVAAVVDLIDRSVLVFLGRTIAEGVARLETDQRLAEALEHRRAQQAVALPSIFRKSALATYAEQRLSRGRPRGSAGGAPGSPFERAWLLAVPLGAALLLAIFSELSDYAIGRGVVELDDRIDVSRPYPSQVRELRVGIGQAVTRDEVLLVLDSTEEIAEADRLARQLDAQLVRYLRDPNDVEARNALTALRAEHESARAQVAARTIRSPIDGAVGAVRVRQGQHVAEGDLLLSLVRGGARPSLLGFVPAGGAPRLEPGQRARLRLDGFPGAFVDLRIATVADDAAPPAEAIRHLGSGAGDEALFRSPVVAVRAKLPGSFEDEGRTYPLTHGLEGTLYIETRSERLVLAVIPWLKEILR